MSKESVINIGVLQKAFSFNKGKGETEKTITSLENSRNLIESEMTELTTKFKRTFRAPWKAHLAVQKHARGTVYVRWRAAGANGQGQSYFELFNSEAGEAILNKVSQEVLAVFCDFERNRIQLNTAHGIINQALIKCREHNSKSKIIDEFLSRHSDAA